MNKRIIVIFIASLFVYLFAQNYIEISRKKLLLDNEVVDINLKENCIQLLTAKGEIVEIQNNKYSFSNTDQRNKFIIIN
jgi:hypothetical protein